MSWFKSAKNFSERNIINDKIRYLKELRDIIESNSKVVFQSGKTVKESSLEMITSSKISSYPSLHEVLIRADTLVLDSPWRYAELCSEAVQKVDQLIGSLKKDREEFTHEGRKEKPKKGWV